MMTRLEDMSVKPVKCEDRFIERFAPGPIRIDCFVLSSFRRFVIDTVPLRHD